MPRTIKAFCPHDDCRQAYKIPPEKLAQEVRCRKCDRSVLLTPETLSGSKPPSTQSPKGKTHPTPQPPSSSGLPTTIGGFTLGERLGQGAFGAVHRGHDARLDRDVAIKLPHPAALTGSDATSRFIREAKAAAALRHPHIVPVYAAGEENGQAFIASAFIDGVPLDKALKAEGQFDVRRAARIVRQLAEALGYAHEQGIIHRDVKPANVMLDSDDNPQLMDFGLARVEGTVEKLTQDGSVMGTPAYMSPEQARGDQTEVGPASDQYSLGVLLYELLTGEVPFRGSIDMVIGQVVSTEPRPVEGNRKAISADLAVVCRKAMSKNSADRYENCAEFAADLERYEAGEPIAARPLGRVQRVIRWAKRKPKDAALVGGIVGSVMLFALIAWGLLGVAKSNELEAKRQASIAEGRKVELELKTDELARQVRRADEKTAEAKQMTELVSEREREASRLAAVAKESAEEAKRQARRAQQEADIAQQQRTLAEDRQTLIAAQAASLKEDAFYARTLALDASLHAGRSADANTILAQASPSDTQWEQKYLMRVARSRFPIRIPISGKRLRIVGFSCNSQYVLIQSQSFVSAFDVISGKLKNTYSVEPSKMVHAACWHPTVPNLVVIYLKAVTAKSGAATRMDTVRCVDIESKTDVWDYPLRVLRYWSDIKLWVHPNDGIEVMITARVSRGKKEDLFGKTVRYDGTVIGIELSSKVEYTRSFSVPVPYMIPVLGSSIGITHAKYSVHPYSGKIAFVDESRTLKVYDLQAESLVASLAIESHAIEAFEWNPEIPTLAFHTDRGLAGIWHIDSPSYTTISESGMTGRILWELQGKRLSIGRRVYDVSRDAFLDLGYSFGEKQSIGALSTSARWNASVRDGTLFIHDLGIPPPSMTYSSPKRVTSVGWHHQSTSLHYETGEKWSIDHHQLAGDASQKTDHSFYVRGRRYSSDGQYVASIGLTPTIEITSSDSTGKAVQLKGHEQFVNAVAWRPQGNRILRRGYQFEGVIVMLARFSADGVPDDRVPAPLPLRRGRSPV